MPGPKPITLRELGRATLARQMLLSRERTTPLAAIERLLAMQAQLPRPPFIGLFSRVHGFRREDLLSAIERRAIVRATALRATLHLLSARDYAALRAAIAPALERAMRSILKTRHAELDVARLIEDARPFLRERPRTFDEVRTHLSAMHPQADDRAMGYAIRTSLPLVMVPAASGWGYAAQSEFTLAEQWLDRPIDLAPTSPRELVLRYLAAYGPASVADAQSFCGLTGLRETFDALRDELYVIHDESGRELFDLAAAPRPPADAPAPVRFVPEFDHLIVAREDERILAAKHREKVFLPGLRVVPVFLIDGAAAGTWKIERKKGIATLALAPFTQLERERRAALEEEGESLLRFVEPDSPKIAITIAKR